MNTSINCDASFLSFDEFLDRTNPKSRESQIDKINLPQAVLFPNSPGRIAGDSTLFPREMIKSQNCSIRKNFTIQQTGGSVNQQRWSIVRPKISSHLPVRNTNWSLQTSIQQEQDSLHSSIDKEPVLEQR